MPRATDGADAAAEICLEERRGGERRFLIRDRRAFVGGQLAIAVLVIGAIAVFFGRSRRPVFSGVVGATLAIAGVGAFVVVRRRRAEVVVTAKETVVREHGYTVAAPTARIRSFTVVAGGTRLGSHTLMIVHEDDSVVATHIPLTSKARAEHVAAVLNRALSRARDDARYRG